MYSNWRKSLRSRRETFDDGDLRSKEDEFGPNGLGLSSPPLSLNESRRQSEPSQSHFDGDSSAIGSPPPLTHTSSYLTTASASSSGRSRDRKNEPLGLHVLYDPPSSRTIDIVFVHGLGGTCRFTWSHDKDLSLFWPKEWLPSEPGFKNARILTFGYNAYFKSANKDVFNISDFAKSLLLQMKVASDEHVEPLNMGQVPIIFVVHSMGGLVVKKAYILGSQDPQYRDIIHQVCGIVFLATPHRGSNLADILNRLLSASFHSPKQYISDLQKSSTRITDINDQFKHFQSKVDLVSFFETRPTPLTLGRKAIVVERDSAILDYPNETSGPLDATHTSISKFLSRTDANYVHVRDILRHLIEKFKVQVKIPAMGLRSRSSIDRDSLRSMPSIDTLMTRLGVAPRPSDTLETLWENYIYGSCDWMLSDTDLGNFLTDESPRPTLMHITGRPGSGKSMMASYLVKHLDELDMPVQFWYFRHDDQLQRSNRNCLLSLAFQMMDASEEYAQKIFALGQDITSIARSDIRTLWQKLFLQPLDKIGSAALPPQPLCWVIDALDESESPQSFLNLFSGLKSLRFPLRVVFLTRLHTMTKPVDRLKASFPADRLSNITLITPRDSLELYISEKLDYTPWTQELKEAITDRLIRKSEGSYLWLSLIMRELVNCDTKEQLDEVIDETPDRLVDVYSRIEQAVSKELRPADKKLVKTILAWVSCAERQLQEEELIEALKPGFSMLNLKHTTSRLCGDFVAIDKKRNFSMIHYTAKEYLLHQSVSVLAVNALDAHTLIFNKCFAVLTEPRFRIRLRSQGCTGFIRYCCLSWPHHLARSDIGQFGMQFTQKLAAFFTSSTCLAWIDAVATAGQLQVLTSTAKILVTFLETYHRMTRDVNPLMQPVEEMDMLHGWSSELVRIVGKFGLHLVQQPSCIYNLVPLFCPQNSMISQHFRSVGVSMPRIHGVSNKDWDDSLAKFSLGHGQSPKMIMCHDTLFGIITSDKAVVVHSASTFQRIAKLGHGERVVTARFNSDGTLMVTGGLKTIKVWEVTTGREISSFFNPDGMRAMEAVFTPDSSEIIVCCMDSNLRRQCIADPEDWLHVPWQITSETGIGRGGGTPSCVAFSPDGSQIAISHRTVPLTVWDTETGNRIGRAEGRRGRQITRKDNVDYPVRLTWCPGANEHILGIFTNGTIFKWYPPDPQLEEMPDSPVATEIACSPDGRLIVTAQRDGSLKILNFENFSVVYNLNCAIRAQSVALSPDGRRIYDLRQSFCNIWEPNALIRTAEQDERSSDTASSHYDGSLAYSLGSEAVAIIHDPITAICAVPHSSTVLVGTAAGKVKFEGEREPNTEMTISPLSIACLAISSCGSYFAAASIDSRVVVRATPSLGSVSTTRPPLHIQAAGSVTQLLFGTDDQTLLVCAETRTEVWSLTDGTCLGTRDTGTKDTCWWTIHPHDEQAFLLFQPVQVESRSVNNFEACIKWQVETKAQKSTIENEMLRLAIERDLEDERASNLPDWSMVSVLTTPWRSSMLLDFANSDKWTKTKGTSGRFRMLETKFLYHQSESENGGIAQATALPRAVEQLIKHPLGFVSDDAEARRGSRDPSHRPSLGSIALPPSNQFEEQCALAFIDHDFWVRSWSIDDADGITKKHFFLPQDWVNMDCLMHSVMTPDGRFICPRNGEVVTLHHALKLTGAEEI